MSLPYDRLLAGEWTRTQPLRPGWYFVATRDGRDAGMREWRFDRYGRCRQTGIGPSEPGWQGWIWSTALPLSPSITPPQET